jgi:hypothetical protein
MCIYVSLSGKVLMHVAISDRDCLHSTITEKFQQHNYLKEEIITIKLSNKLLPATGITASNLHKSLYRLTLSLLMSCIYETPFKARNFNVVCIWTYFWQRWKSSLFVFCTVFQHWINAESFPVAQLCVNTLPATKITLIKDWI